MKKIEKETKKDFLSPPTKNARGHLMPGSAELSSIYKSSGKPRKDSVPKIEEPYNFAKELFKLFDPEGKGYIDILEVKRLLGIFKASIPSLMATRIIAEVDSNGDGRIDFKEFEEMLKLEPEHGEREKDDMLRAFKFIAEDPTYITKKKIDEIISDKRYADEPIFLSNLEFDENGKLNYRKAVNMFYSLSELNKPPKKNSLS